MTDTEGCVDYHTDSSVVTITLNRPAKLNAITRPMHDELLAAFRRFDSDPEAYILVLRAEGKSFCAGRDIAEQASSGASPTEDLDPTLTQYGLPRTDKVVVTAARGHALGAGGLGRPTERPRRAGQRHRVGEVVVGWGRGYNPEGY